MKRGKRSSKPEPLTSSCTRPLYNRQRWTFCGRGCARVARPTSGASAVMCCTICPMRADPLKFLSDELETLRQQGSYRKLRVLEGEQQAHATFDRKSVVNLSSNNYLG